MAKITGRQKAAMVLKRIPDRVQSAARAQQDKNAAELVEMMRRLAPKDEGDLAASIGFVDLSDDAYIRHRVHAGGPTTTKAVRKSEKGGAPKYDYASAIEHGTSERAAKPFFFPSYRAKRKTFKARVSKAVRTAVKDAAGS